MQELTKIQNLIKVVKNELNSYGNYKYRTAEAIMHAVKPHLLTYNFSLYFRDQILTINNIIIIKAIPILENNETGKKIYGVGYAGVDLNTKGMHMAQCFGTSTSYARKCALQGLFLLDDAKDDIDGKDNSKANNNETVVTKNNYETVVTNEPKELTSIANNKIKPCFAEANFLKAYQSKVTFDEIRKYYILTEEIRQKYILFITEQKQEAKLK